MKKGLSKSARVLRTTNKVKTIQKAVRARIERAEHTIQIIYDVTTEDTDGVLTTQEYDSKVFTVFGGKQKIRKAIETTSKYIYDYLKDSYDWELTDFKIKRIFIDKIKKNITDFKDIKMFGTLLNICGYDLNVVNTEIKDACCVEYHVKMFNSYRNHGWTNERFMDETGMASISEGVTLNQMIPIYIKYRIGYHIVDFKYHKTASHNDHNYTPTKHYPSLFYMIENNHLYQITNKHDTKSISQLETGKPHKTFKHKEVKPVKRTVHKFHRPIEILAMIGQARFDECSQIFDMELCKNDIFVCETPHVIHDLFYTLLKKNMLYNKNIRVNNTRITQFNIGNITIQENTDYKDVASTIEHLNTNITIDADKYLYHGQSIHRLAHDYYERNHNKNYNSQMSPQVADVYNDPLSKNTAFNVTLKEVEATYAVDFNKMYAYILKCCCNDKFGWSQYTPIDLIQPFDKTITTGTYFVTTTNCNPLHGNGWYADAVVCDALDVGIITYDDIKYQIKASNVLSPQFFQAFVENIVNNFNGYKKANNGFIGILAKNYNTYEKHYFTQNRMTALAEWMKKPSETSFTGIYDNSQGLHSYEFMRNADNLQSMIDIAMDKNKHIDPMVWMIEVSKKTHLYNNSLPIHRKIYDVANMMVYKKHLQIMALNPLAQLVRIKTDLLGYVGINNEIEDSVEWGEVKREWIPPKPGQLWDVSKLTRTNEYKHNNKPWRNHRREFLDNADIQSILKNGGKVYGMAGTGKSTTLKQIKEALPENIYITGTFTHKAASIVGGTTLHRLLGIDVKTHKIDYKLIKSYVTTGVKYIFIDEISMIPSWLWNVLAHVKQQYGFTFIGCGDWKQLAPVDEEDIDFENAWLVKYLFNSNSYELTKVWRFNENQLLQDAYSASNGDKINFTKYQSTECELALCHTNDAVDAINKKWNEHYAKQHTKQKEVIGFDNTKFIMYTGLMLMAYKTHTGNTFTNSQDLVIKSWTDTTFQLQDDKGNTIELDMKYTTSFKPRFALTVHKSQGSTYTENYSIYEYESMKPRMLYVALTRARTKKQVNFCKIEGYTPHTGHIYSYEYHGQHYIGSTLNLKKRKDEHKNGTKSGNTKFKNAINKYGFDKFNYKVVETIKYNNIKELWGLEDAYIIKYDSIDNGFNSRFNK